MWQALFCVSQRNHQYITTYLARVVVVDQTSKLVDGTKLRFKPFKQAQNYGCE